MRKKATSPNKMNTFYGSSLGYTSYNKLPIVIKKDKMQQENKKSATIYTKKIPQPVKNVLNQTYQT